MSSSSSVIPFRPRAEPVMPKDARSDDELMLLARAGQRDAFAELVRRHQAVVLRVAAKELGDVTLAKDAAQATFLEIHRFLPRYQPTGKFRAFLHRVLINQCRMAGRSRTRVRNVPDDVHGELAPPSLPDQVLLRRERRRSVEAAVRQLPEKQRMVVILRFTGELDHQEIGDVLGIPVGTVKSRLFHALRELRLILKGEEP